MRELEIIFNVKTCNSKAISEINFGQERNCRWAAAMVERAIEEDMRR